MLPSCDQAVHMYRESGGRISDEHDAGQDLLKNHPNLKVQRETQFWQRYQGVHNYINNDGQFNNSISLEHPNVAYIFSRTACHDYLPLQQAILLHIHFSERLFQNSDLIS